MTNRSIAVRAIGALILCASAGATAAHPAAGGGAAMGATTHGAAVGAAVNTNATMAPTGASTQTTTQLRGPTHTGQPNQTCGTAGAMETPGNAALAPGSAFNPDGQAGQVYAGQQPQNQRNTASVSQYDVACSHQP